MPKNISSLELTLDDRPDNDTLARWLYTGLCRAILDGRLRPGSRLPATRDFARQYRVSRGTVVNVFERLQADGYVSCRVGAGTWVNHNLPQAGPQRAKPLAAPAKVLPEPLAGLAFTTPARPFRMDQPALAHFPAEVWTRLAGRRLRRLSSWLQVRDDGRGYRPLCEAIADYLGSSRGVKCSPDQIVIVSGIQQALDLLARFLLKPGDPVWMEDPGYFGATLAFRHAGAQIVPAPVDEHGVSVSGAGDTGVRPKGVFVTPGHQFPLGMTLSLERRLALLAWAGAAGAFIIEDDYDSEYRFEGRPAPALQGLDNGSNVVFLGTFTKLLFPSLRLGYVVLPPRLVDPFLAFRYGTDLRSTSLDQAILCDFITGGHLGRHLRRMRQLYAGRLAALRDAAREHLQGLLEIADIRAGLYTAGLLRNGMTSRQAEEAAWAAGVETMGLHRFTLERPDPRGLLLGFAAFDEAAIRRGVTLLAAALDRKNI
jgi:GntR family transcriptional regulator/MocR family aminotransferase